MVHSLIVFGGRGFIGSHFPATIKTHHTPMQGFEVCDLRSPKLTFSTEGISYALIAAGVGNPTQCERDPEGTYAINVTGSLALGQLLIERGITPIFCSSDYVFDGSERSYTATSAHAPLNVYGEQKSELEKRALDLWPGGCVILRLSKIYGLKRGDGTLLDEMTAQFCAGKTVQAATDQEFCPLAINDLVRATACWMADGKRGVAQCAGKEAITRFALAQKVAHQLGMGAVHPISLDDLAGLRRPKRTALKSVIGETSLEESIEILVRQYVRKKP